MSDSELKKLGESKIGQWNKATIITTVRKLLEIGEGDTVEWLWDGKNIIVKKKSEKEGEK